MQQQTNPVKQEPATQLGQSKPVQTFKSVKSTKNHTFNANAIVPIIRTVQVSSQCYAIYSTLHKVPLAVHQFLDQSIIEGNATREGTDFYQQVASDPKDQKFYIDSKFYEQTGSYKQISLDKGHMAPAKNYCGSQQLMNATYTYANCIPQNSYFNRGSWKNLQSYCRNLIRNNIADTIQIISGPVFYGDALYKNANNVYENHEIVMMKNGIIVPPKCYKIIKANVGQHNSFVSAFVMKNQKFIDNEFLLKSFAVQIEQLQLMTGLRFNLGKYESLQKLDPAGMKKTMGDLHLQFYNKLFKNSKTLAEMNGARKQGFIYKTHIDIKIIPKQEKIKMGLTDFQNIIQQNGWTRTKAKARRKINALLGLHRDAKQLDALTQQLQKKIIENIKANIQLSKNEQDKQYHRWISAKLYNNNYGYVYPFQQQLKAIFPKYGQKQEANQNDHQNAQTQQAQQNSNSIPISKPKKKYTPKKQKEQTNKQSQQTPKDEKKQKEKRAKKSEEKQDKNKETTETKVEQVKKEDSSNTQAELTKLQIQFSSMTITTTHQPEQSKPTEAQQNKEIKQQK